ncbi:MAG: GNAT family N-acetyltransferase [Clostridia bacterium]|nr:GNAT family N-acetyltransferase [Clostridia bacterium]MBR3553249.1 GNAT family N-acetyltransferase [Clostridia bacterium]
MMDICMLSNTYDVRTLSRADIDSIFELCQRNTQYYRYCEAEPTKEQIKNDMQLLPPGVQPSDKYYIGFFLKNDLVAVMDLVDGYPEEPFVFIGFFMMKKALQGQGIGTAIIQECSAYFKTLGKTTIRLAIDKGNPQSAHFWKKNGFIVIREVERGDWTLLVADKLL